MEPLLQPEGESTQTISRVHFTPGARTAWHSHDGGQTLWVTEGHGLVQARGEKVVSLQAGDVHTTPRWTGALARRDPRPPDVASVHHAGHSQLG
jgi:quercetin dioxygenase-like cupin family protein